MTDNLLAVIGTDTQLKRVASTNGGEYAGPCPLCPGGVDRLRVWPNQDGGKWWCRQCERGGDAVAYLVEAGRIDKREAYRLRHGDACNVSETARAPAAMPTPPKPATPPSQQWQGRAWEFAAQSQDALWSEAGSRALSWLHMRGLQDETIRHAGLGYNARDQWDDRDRWGLPAEISTKTGNSKRVWLPRGVVLPWFIGDDLWRVNIRRPVKPGEEPKCIGPAGFGNGLYEADRLKIGKPAILVEGELDVLTVLQEAGDLVSPVATGGTGGARRARWVAKLALCRRVLVAFDADEAGERVRRWWLETLENGKYWRPYWGDANALHQDGANVRGWVAAGLGAE